MLENKISKLNSVSSVEEKQEIISNLGIYELRALARALGVSSPTTKKRDFLVNAILELLETKKIDMTQKSNKGRPCKKLDSIDEILNLINSDTKIIELPKSYNFEDILLFAQEIPVFEYESKDEILKKGVLRIVKNVSYFIDSEENVVVFISNDMVSKFQLKNGDFLEVKAYKINQNNQFNAKSITKINNVNSNKYKSGEEISLEKQLPSKLLDVGKKKILLGGKNNYILSDPIYLDSEIQEVLSTLDKPENNVVYLGVNVCEEEMMLLEQCENYTVFASKYGDANIGNSFNKIIDSINLAERTINRNENVIFIISDVVGIMNALDLYFSSTDSQMIYDHLQQSNVVMKKIISLASTFKSGKDCTILMINNKIDLDDQFIKNQVLKISKNI